jgi:hypothetical protein
MKVTAPVFREGYEYRQMSVKDGGGVYRFVTLKEIIFEVDEDLPRLKFTNRDRVWMETGPGFYSCPAGYTWNGCTPKWGKVICGRDFWFGTPDFEGTRAASLSHDLPFQFSGLPEMPIDIIDANLNFKSICEQNKFFMTNTYYGALLDFSKRHWGKEDSYNDCILVLRK